MANCAAGADRQTDPQHNAVRRAQILISCHVPNFLLRRLPVQFRPRLTHVDQQSVWANKFWSVRSQMSDRTQYNIALMCIETCFDCPDQPSSERYRIHNAKYKGGERERERPVCTALRVKVKVKVTPQNMPRRPREGAEL